MLYIVEIPHQRPASCWVASDENDFCTRTAAAFARHGDTPNEDTFDAWRDYLASDLHRLHVFMSDAEALAALDDATFDCHQGGRARAALEEKLTEYGILQSQDDSDGDEE